MKIFFIIRRILFINLNVILYALDSDNGAAAFSQTQVEYIHENESQRYQSDLNRSFRRQRLQCTTGDQKRGFTTLPNRKDSKELHNDATKLNNNGSDNRKNRISFELQPELASNKTENDGGQPLVRNEIHNTSYRLETNIPFYVSLIFNL